MAFWIAMAILAAAVTLALLAPLFRPRSALNAKAVEVAIYRDQLDEIGRDVERGVLGEAEAKEARNEIARRLIKAGEAGAAADAGDRSRRRSALIAAAVAVPVISVAGYLALGEPNTPDRPIDARLAAPDPADVFVVQGIVRAVLQNPQGINIDGVRGLVDVALTDNPDHPALLEALAFVAVMQNRPDDVVAAFDRYARVAGEQSANVEELGTALGQQAYAVTGSALGATEAIFFRVLLINPRSRAAQVFLTIALEEKGQTAEAEAAWAAMLAEAPPGGAPWADLAATRLAALRGEAPPAPVADPAAAIANLPAADQMAFIEARVADLAARLAAEPRNPEGWSQLIRSYVVLERTEDARAAVASARTAFAAEAVVVAQIEDAVVAPLTATLHADQTDARTWVQLIRSYMVLGRIDQARSGVEAARTVFAGNADALGVIEAVARELEQ